MCLHIDCRWGNFKPPAFNVFVAIPYRIIHNFTALFQSIFGKNFYWILLTNWVEGPYCKLGTVSFLIHSDLWPKHQARGSQMWAAKTESVPWLTVRPKKTRFVTEDIDHIWGFKSKGKIPIQPIFEYSRPHSEIRVAKLTNYSLRTNWEVKYASFGMTNVLNTWTLAMIVRCAYFQRNKNPEIT